MPKLSGAIQAPSLPGFIPDAEFDSDMAGGGEASAGFIPDSQFESDEDKYGGVTGALKAFGLGTFSGATLGLSNLALTKSGLVNPETIKGLQEENPISNIAGEIGSVFIPGGAIGLIGKAGKATYQGTKAIKAIKEMSVASKVLGGAADIGAHALGSAVEGAIYAGVGNSINEYALGDPNLNGEKILANFGNGALFGGAFGAVLKGASIGAPEAVNAAKKSRDWLIGTGKGDDSLMSKIIEKLPEAANPNKTVSEAWKNRIANLGVDQRGEIVKETTEHINTFWNNISSGLKYLNEKIRPAERDELINASAPSLKVIQDARQGLIDKMNQTIETIKSNPHIYHQGPGAQLELQRLGIVNAMGEDLAPAQIMKRLQEAKQNLQKIGYDAGSASAAESRTLIKGITNDFRDVLHNPDVFGLAGSAQAEHDNMLHNIYQFISPNARKTTEFQKAFMKKTGSGDSAKWVFDNKKMKSFLKNYGTPEGAVNEQMFNEFMDTVKGLPEHLDNTFASVPNELWENNAKFNKLSENINSTAEKVSNAQAKYLEATNNSKGSSLGLKDLVVGGTVLSHPVLGGLAAAYDLSQRPIEYINKLAGVERLLNELTNNIGKGAKSIFTPAIEAVSKVKGPLIRNSTEDHKAVHKDLTALMGDPNAMIDKLNESTGILHDTAPDTTQGLQQAMIRGVQFLSTKLPSPQEVSPFDKDEYEPSQSQLQDFNRYYSVVEDPTIIFDHLKDGTIGKEDIETLSTVYPSLYGEMKQAVLNEAINTMAKKEKIPYQTKLAVSMFLGEPIDKSFSSQAIQANQQAFMAANQAQAQEQARASSTGMGKLNVADRTKVQQSRDA